MAKEKETPGKGEEIAPKKPDRNTSSVFLFGVLFGVVAGIFVGWWFPPPSGLRQDIDQSKVATRIKIQEFAVEAKDKTVRVLEDKANTLRSSPPSEALQHVDK